MRVRNKGHKTVSHTTSAQSLLLGLTIAGVSSAILTTTFNLFYVDTFLIAYKLPLSSYATGNIVYAVINTANDVGGGWLVDFFAHRNLRNRIVWPSGCLFALCFLGPFFRWGQEEKMSETGLEWKERSWSATLDLAHFVLSVSIYDTMYSFSAILFGSMFTDNHNLSKNARIGIMAVGRVAKMVCSFTVARVALQSYNPQDLTNFRHCATTLCTISCFLFIIAHLVVQPKENSTENGFDEYAASNKEQPSTGRGEEWITEFQRFRKMCRDLIRNKNFRAWVVMEMLLECQTNFSASFSKLFVDRLLFETGMSRKICDWILSAMGPCSQLVGLALYLSIRKVGYHKLYTWLFCFKFGSSILMLTFGSPKATNAVCSFLVLNNVLTSAVMSTGFHLAMSDMATEFKFSKTKEQRSGEPSLAGTLMGANALLCKPMDSFLPVVAAWSLTRSGFSIDREDSEDGEAVQWTLYYVLIGPSLIFSVIQLYAWKNFNLDGGRADNMREELRKYNDLVTLNNKKDNEELIELDP